MEDDIVWQHIDGQRIEVAALVERIDPSQWSAPSLCAGWTVGNVAAHLTHSAIGTPRMLWEAARSGFRFNAVVHRMAVTDTRSPAQVAAQLRDLVGSRRHPPGTTALEPLTDVLVHAQDICIPLGIDRAMPADAAAAAAARVWTMGFPFHARRRFSDYRLVATDTNFAVGDGREVSAPIRELLLLLTGRSVHIPGLG